jgi:hypothetical protein
MGLPKGKTNNPNGRPAGAINKLASDCRLSIAELLNDNQEKIREELQGLSGREFLSFAIALLKYVVPTPTDTVEEQKNHSELIDAIIKASKSKVKEKRPKGCKGNKEIK